MLWVFLPAVRWSEDVEVVVVGRGIFSSVVYCVVGHQVAT